jgi:hypothetical protein
MRTYSFSAEKIETNRKCNIVSTKFVSEAPRKFGRKLKFLAEATLTKFVYFPPLAPVDS